MNKWGGDAAVSFADTKLAARFLSWRALLGLEAMCGDGSIGTYKPCWFSGADS